MLKSGTLGLDSTMPPFQLHMTTLLCLSILQIQMPALQYPEVTETNSKH